MAIAETTIIWANNDQVTSSKLNEIVSGLTFVAGAVANSTLTVVGGQLKVGTITANEIGMLSIATGSIQNLAVTGGKIADGAVTNLKIGAQAVTGDKIALGAVTFNLIAIGAIAQQSQMVNQFAGYIVTPEVMKFSPVTAKAYGEFDIINSSRAIKTGSYNIQSLTRIDSTHTAVSLATNMDSVRYTVDATFLSDTGTEREALSIYQKSVTGFRIFHPAEAANRGINFVVFGKYA
jgi:hypothetical protein